jgi:hypothetical protein
VTDPISSADFQRVARDVLADVLALRERTAEQGRTIFRRWSARIERPAFRVGALNFAHYLAFRRHDLRPLQRRLMALGLSSLGRPEGRVIASLDAVILALCGIAATPAPNRIRWPSHRQFFRGERRLAQNCREIFGEPQPGRAGKILVTLGTDAAFDPEVVANLVASGADAVRINCAHDNPDVWSKMIAHTRLDVGDPISIDDGKLRGHIVRHTARGLVARIEEGRAKGIKLKAEKGLNFPGVNLGLDPLTDRDAADLDFIEHEMRIWWDIRSWKQPHM